MLLDEGCEKVRISAGICHLWQLGYVLDQQV